jgi:uncharacterized damage-inducible protein DinB
MTTYMADRYRRWFEYEKDAHQKVLTSLNAVPGAQRAAPPFQKAVVVFAHIMAARKLWLFRFGATSENPAELSPQGVTLEDLDSLMQDIHAAWSAYLDRIDDTELGRVFEYQSLEGPWFRSRVEDILAQLFGHSWYHRGQIASLVKSAGGAPAATDFVFWSREPIT